MSQTTLRVDFISESAGYRNSFGWYDKTTGLGGVLFANVEADGRKAPLNPGSSYAEFTVATAGLSNIEFFLIPDGADQNSNNDLNGPIKVIQLSNGTWAVARADSNGNAITKNGKPDILEGEGANALFTETSKNAGGVDYASSAVGSSQTSASLTGDTADGPTGLLAWEDLAATKKSNGTYTKPGDADYNDAVFQISVANGRPEAHDDDATLSEDSGATAISVLGNDSDPDGDPIKVVWIDDDDVLGTISIAPGGAGIVFNPGSAYQYLGAGESKTETIEYKISDGNSGTDTAKLKVEIVGVNDGPVVTDAEAAGSVTEKADGSSSENGVTHKVSGEIEFEDADNNDDHTVSVTPQGPGYLGTFTVSLSSDDDDDDDGHSHQNGNGHYSHGNGYGYGHDDDDSGEGTVKWTFKVHDSAIDFLSAGQVLIQSYNVEISDGNGGTVTQVVTVTLIGTNDKPKIESAVTQGTVTELADNAPGENVVTHTATGDIDFEDVDLADVHSVVVTPQGSGYRGALAAVVSNASTGDGEGTVTWTYSVDDAALDDLAAGQTLTQTYKVKISDGQGGAVEKTVTITINGAADGANNGPVITSDPQAGAATEIADLAPDENAIVHSASGAVTFSDSNPADTHTAAFAPQGGGYRGTFALAPVDQGADSVGWTFDVDDADLDNLSAGQTLLQHYDVTIDDGNGGSAVQTVTITVNGTNDAPTITSAVQAGSATEVADLAPGENTDIHSAGGAVTFSDVDLNDLHSAAFAPQGGGYRGTFALASVDQGADSVGWTFEVNDSALDDLAAGQTLIQHYDITVSDGQGGFASQTVTVTITGTNDIPVIGGVSTGSVQEDVDAGGGNLSASGTLTILDADAGQSLFQAQGSTAGTYGTFALDASGHWTYTADNAQAAIQGLAVDEALTDSFTAVSADGTASQLVTVTINGTNDVVYTVNDTIDSTATKSGAGTELIVGSGIPANGFGLANQMDVGVELGLQIIYRQGPVVLSSDDYADGRLEFTVNDGPQSTENGSFANHAGRAAWNFQYSVATGLDGETTDLDDFTFYLRIDLDPTAAQNYAVVQLAYDPLLNVVTPQNPSPSGYIWEDVLSNPAIVDDAGNANVTQNSQNYAFYQSFLTGGVYGLANNFDGPAQFDLVLEAHRSGQLLADNHIVVNVVESNDAPVAQNDAASVQEDVTLAASGNVLTNDLDNDVGDTKTVTEVNGQAANVGVAIATAYGTVTINADGSYTYNLDNASPGVQSLAAGQQVTDTFTYTMADLDGAASSAGLNVTLTGTNDAPEFVVSTGNLLVNGSFEDPANGFYVNYFAPSDAGAIPGWLIVQSGVQHVGTFWQAADGFNSVQMKNPGLNHFGAIEQTFATMPGAEYFVTFDMTANWADGATHSILVSADGQSQAYTANGSGNNNSSMGWSARSFTFTADGSSATLRIESTDTFLYGAIVDDFTVTSLTTPTEGSVTEAADDSADEIANVTHQATGSLAFTDVDLLDTHTVTVAPMGGGAGYRGILSASVTDISTGDGSGAVTWTFSVADADLDDLNTGDVLTQTYNVTVQDNHGAPSTQTVTITINGADDGNSVPIVTEPPAATTDEDTSIDIAGMSVSDSDSANLTVSLTANSTLTLGSIAGLTFTDGDGTADQTMTFSGSQADINAAIGTMTYAPTSNDSGERGFSYSVSDGIDVVAGDVTVDVAPIADAPTLIIGTPGGGGDPTPMRLSAGVHQYDMRDLYDDLSLGTLTFTQGDPSLPIIPPIDPSFRFTVTTSAGVTYVASGQGFTYNPGDNMPTGGTIMGLEIKDPGDPLRPFLSLTNGGLTPDEFWAIPAADFVAAIGAYAASPPLSRDTSGLDAIFKTNTRWNEVGQDDGIHPGGHHNDIFVGGDLNDTIAGADGADTLFGGGGTDLLIGGADQGDVNWGQGGADWFQLAGTTGAPEDDIIADFSGVVGGEGDIIDISANINVTWAMVQAGTSQVGDDTVIHIFDPSPTIFADLRITLLDFNAADLREEDFVLFGQTNPLAATFNSGGGGSGGSGDTASGNEDTLIALPAISASLNDIDGSETLSLSIGNIPVGATLSDGAGGHSFTATAGNTTADIIGWSLSSISILPPPNFFGSFNLTVEATATDAATLSSGPAADTESTLATIPVTVNPVNDPASITGDASGSVTEDGTLVATGDLNSSDPDGVNDSWMPVVAPAASANGYGTYTVNAAGEWTYSLNNSHAAVQALGSGAMLFDTFMVSTADGASQVVSITINGTDDAPAMYASTPYEGADFIVNGTGTGDQFDPDIAALPDGRAIATWFSVAGGGTGFDIWARFISAEGQGEGADFRVNTVLASDQDRPSVAAMPDGSFLIAWDSLDSGTSNFLIRGRTYDESGTPTGPDFVINSSTAPYNNAAGVNVLALPSGQFLVTWYATGAAGDGFDAAIRGRLLSDTGVPAGPDFVLNTTTVNSQITPDGAVLADGSHFVVTWRDSTSPIGGDGLAIHARVFNLDGSGVGSDFEVAGPAGHPGNPTVAALADGRFVVTWTEVDATVETGLFIRGRLYDANGTAAGDSFVVNSVATGDQANSEVVALPQGGFLVTWHSNDAGADGSGLAIRARMFDSNGNALGPDFVLNTTGAGDQVFPTVQVLSDGRLLAAWQSGDSGDGSGTAIRARILDLGADYGRVNEVEHGAAGENTATHVTSGSIAFADIDVGDSHLLSVTPAGGGAGYRGTFDASIADSATADGTGRIDWSLSVDDSALNDLAPGQTLTQVYTLTLDDENGGISTQDVTVTIHGAADTFAPTDILLNNASVNESVEGAVVGTITVVDPDVGDTFTYEVDDDRFEVSGGQLKLKDGIALDFEQEPSVQITVAATDSGGLGINRTFTVSVVDGDEGVGSDGYIAGATVFADANNNGTLDGGEASTTTDAFGNFILFGGSGPLIMYGGTDIATGHAFTGIMRAPEGSTVVTPLTTLVVAVAPPDATPEQIADANAAVLQGLGLPAGIDLATFDPIYATVSGDPTLESQGQAAVAAAVQIQNTVVQAASLLAGAGADIEDAAAAVVTQLAAQISSQTLDLNNATVVTDVITSAATAVGANATSVAETAAGAANVISATNQVVSTAATGETGTDLLTTLAQVSVVAQGTASAALVDAGTTGTAAAIATVEAGYTGTALTDAVDAAEAGDVLGANGDQTLDGTAAADTLIGGAGNDTLNGLGGNDTLVGGIGNDFADGGTGWDRAVFTDATGGVTINMAVGAGDGTATGAGIGTDTLRAIEAARGSNFADTYTATGFNSGAQVTPGLPPQFNEFEGMGGDDTIVGTVSPFTGNGFTRISYVSATSGVTVTSTGFGVGTVTGDASVGTDSFTGVASFRGANFADSMFGSSNPNFTIESFEGRGGNDFISGGGGSDRAIYSNDPAVASGIQVNMRQGIVTGDAATGTDTLRSVEGIRGTNYADVYDATDFGLAGDPNLFNIGSNGNSNDFEGAGGNDTIIGNGNTRVSYQTALAGVTVDIVTGTGRGTAPGDLAGVAIDTFIPATGVAGKGVSGITGSAFNDFLYGSNNPVNTTQFFDGRQGDDYIDGRGGFDQVSYNEPTIDQGVTVTFASGDVFGNWSVGHDTLRSIESVRGTFFDDIFDATGFSNTSLNAGSTQTPAGGWLNEFEGMHGNDTITGNGSTRIVYVNATGSVTADLAAGTVTGNDSVGTDTIVGGVFRVRGSNFDDAIYGGSGDDVLEGQSGNDRLGGRGGNDVLFGNAGADTYVFRPGFGNDWIGNSTSFDLTLAGPTADVIEFETSMFADFAAVQAAMTQSGSNTVIVSGSDMLTIFGRTPGQFSAANFTFVTNQTPTDIALSANAIAENSATGTVIGTLSGTDADSGQGDLLTFSLLYDVGGAFALNGNQLVLNSPIDHERSPHVSLIARATDLSGATYDETVAISVTNVAGATVNGTGGADVIGAPPATSEEDIISGDAGNDDLSGGDGNDNFTGGADDDTIHGGAGIDRAIYTDATGPIAVNMAAGTVSGAGVGADQIDSVESVRGTAYDDNYNAVGYAGASGLGSIPATFNDFEGMGGDDIIVGNGNTRVSYMSAAAGVTVDIRDQFANGTAPGDLAGVGNDTISGVSAVRGSEYDDILRGSDNPQFGPAEIFEGRGGNDLIVGRGGYDRATYSSMTIDSNYATGPITVDMAAGTVVGDASIGTDTLRGIESVRGTMFDDSYDATGFSNLSANAGASGTFNEFEGMGGNDAVVGNGNTRLSYNNSTGAVTVDLIAGFAAGDASIGHDTFTGVNAVLATSFDDTIYGSDNAPFTSENFEGRAGNDYIDGRGGFDSVSYNNDLSLPTTAGIVVQLAAGIVTGDASIGTDTLRSVESANGTSFGDTYDATGFGDVGALNVGSNGTFNQFQGMAGNDTIIGNGNTQIAFFNATSGVTVNFATGTADGDASVGDDIFTNVNLATGSSFGDTFVGAAGTQSVRGNAGNDIFVYADGGGADFFQDFTAGAGSDDRTDLTGVTGIYTFGDVLAIASQQGSNTVLDFGGGDTLQLTNVLLANLHQDDFILAPPPVIVGTNGNDTLLGTPGPDLIQGLDGDDSMQGFDGSDTLEGGNGRDRASYVDATGPITVDLAAGVVSGAGVGSDSLSSVEIVRSSNFDDILVATGFGTISTNAASLGPNGTASNAIFEGMGGNDAITGTGSTLISYQSATAGVTVNFTGGGAGNAQGTDPGDIAGVGTDAFAGVSFVRGSAFNDTFNGSNNTTGLEQIIGGEGNDTINGASGFDRASYFSLFEDSVTGGITVNLAAGTVVGDASVGSDTLTGVEAIRGTKFNDVYNATGFNTTGNPNNGNAGSIVVGGVTLATNEFEGVGGDDQITGNGNTRISYNLAAAGVTVNLASGQAFGTDAGDIAGVGSDTITLSTVNSVIGSNFDDILTGSSNAANTSETFDGRWGNDIINGGNGFDVAVYNSDTAVTTGIAVTMTATTMTVAGDGAVGTDTLTAVEGVRGTNFADTYNATGWAGASADLPPGITLNEFEGMGGDDSIVGNGNTRISFQNTQVGAGLGVTVNMLTGIATGSATGTDTFTGVSRVRGSNNNDVIIGDNANNTLEGQNGNDRIQGGGGNDTMFGGGGVDTFVFRPNFGNDVIGSTTNFDFTAGVGGDIIEFQTSVFADFAAVQAAMSAVGTDPAVITLGSNTITLMGRTVQQLTAANFAFVNNLAPTDIALPTSEISENSPIGSIVGSLVVADADMGDTHSFTLVDDAGGRFAISGSNLVTNTVFDHETTPAADVRVRVTDDGGATFDKTFTVTIANVTGASLTGTSGNDTIGVPPATGEEDTIEGLAGEDNLAAGNGNDTLIGGADNDQLFGEAGDDTLQGGDGNDALNGGDGRDRASYVDATGPITVDLAAGTVTGAGVGTDTLQSIEIVRGSNFDDILVATGFGTTSSNAASLGPNGTASNAIFEGMGGNDTITGTGSTLVSYQSAMAGVTVTFTGGGAGNAQGTDPGDIAGVGIDTFTGVSFVRGSAYNDTFNGTNNAGGTVEQFIGGAGNDTISGAGGFDRASYFSLFEDAATGGVTVNLAAGTVVGDASIGSDTLTGIEAIRGTKFNDVFDATGFSTSGNPNNGTAGAIVVSGVTLAFNEFEGVGGNDTITGNGNTRLSYSLAAAGVTVDLSLGTAYSSDAGDIAVVGVDTITGGVNIIVGSNFADSLIGTDINVPGAAETFEGRWGDDSIDGRGGFDIAAYGNDAAVTSGIAVTASAATLTVTGGFAVGTDTLTGVESVRGTGFVDTFDATGFAGASGNLPLGATFNEFEGLGGNDIITGNGNTRISYVNSTGGVTVDLDAGTAVGNASVGSDTIVGGVSRVRGSNNNDTISGNAGNNTLEGQSGNDRIEGRGGNDTMTGGTGGAPNTNSDTFVFRADFGLDTITDFTAGSGTNRDIIEFSTDIFADFAALSAVGVMEQDGANAVINAAPGIDTITLNNVNIGDLVSANFQFVVI